LSRDGRHISLTSTDKCQMKHFKIGLGKVNKLH